MLPDSFQEGISCMQGIIKRPNSETKLNILAESAKYDVCLSSCNENPVQGKGRVRNDLSPLTSWIYPAQVPGKGTVSILKVLQTNVCENRCSYCMLACNRDSVQRVTFAPEELAKLFMDMVNKRLVEGIFLSSGIGLAADCAMGSMVATASILRRHYHFKGYIHLKILPGVSFELIDEAAKIADRISINMEAPSRAHLGKIAPNKNMPHDIISRMRYAGRVIQGGAYAKSQTTQLVVGASNETDTEILSAVDWVYRELFLYRSYFSAFQNPNSLVKENRILLREHRLYQCDFLLRGYGFRLNDIVFDKKGNIPLDCDPKEAYVLMHPEIFPVDVNIADESELLKVPGIGPISAKRIVNMRRENPFHNLIELKSAGVLVSKAGPFVLFSGKKDPFGSDDFVQNELFDFGETEGREGWQTGVIPYEPEKLAVPGSSHAYEYPGQTGKPLTYHRNTGESPIYCR
jgi:predicted DNA-binding helix-hairpin-helix protein